VTGNVCFRVHWFKGWGLAGECVEVRSFRG
jgi:hypothetical protein